MHKVKNETKEKIEIQMLELIKIFEDGYTTNRKQLKRLLGIKTIEEDKYFNEYLDEFALNGQLELYNNGTIYIGE